MIDETDVIGDEHSRACVLKGIDGRGGER